MMDQQDRRAAGVQRVTVERVVEICGREPGIPAFEAESVELSGRGMHVRTPYLPELNAPLVCRLEHESREIVVEGVVAWRHQTDEGGEFGVKFTALDGRSVDVLKTLCGLGKSVAEDEMTDLAPEPEPEPALAEPSPPPPLATPGQPVKLHIEGLGSPMKARVRQGSKRRVHVGSNLEFLKVGRSLEIENVGKADRLSAYIDSVSVSVDPQTDVPQLVVTLRYEGVEDTTPEPSVLAAEPSETPADVSTASPALRIALEPQTSAQPTIDENDEDAEYEETSADDGEADIDRFVQQSAVRERLETIAKTATIAARSTGRLLARVSGAAATGAGKLARQAGEKVSEIREQRSKAARRRTTSPMASIAPATYGRRLRPQSGVRKPEEAAGGISNARKKRIALATAGIGVVLAGAVMAFAGRSDEEALAKAPETAVAQAPAPSVEIITPPAMKIVAAPEEASPQGAPRNKQGMVADVPLFGPTPMATMEPAPLEPPADDIEEAAADDVPDERFEEPVRVRAAPTKSAVEEGSAEAPEEPAKPQVWGTGKLHLPFVHRIKLDEVGGALEGAKKSNGFTVFLPNRKLLETGKAIARRDDRIVEVRTSNETRGARVTFVFQGQVPTYKVRIKGQYVEFFVSSPEGR